jgi:hypothetical protein
VHRPHLALAALTAVSPLLFACATSSHPASSANQSPAAPSHTTAATPKTDQSQLTGEEITAANLPTAYDLVDRLRRPWLRRDAVTGVDVVVYMDEQNIGGADKLRDIPSVDVAAMQYLPNADAIRRWGSDIKGSVIVITRRR